MNLYITQLGCTKREKHTIMYSSLYKVETLKVRPQSQAAILFKDRSEYIWGAEIIGAFSLNEKETSITHIEITEEISYF